MRPTLAVVVVCSILSACAHVADPEPSGGCAADVGLLSVPVASVRHFVLEAGAAPAFVFFLLAGESDETVSQSEIRIHDAESNCLVQTVSTAESGILAADATALEVVDLNFDGLNDFRFPLFRTAGPNTPYQHWRYDPMSGRFVSAAALDALSAPVFEHDTQTVRSNWRDGAAVYGSDRYQYSESGLVLVESVVDRYDESGACTRTRTQAATASVQHESCDQGASD